MPFRTMRHTLYPVSGRVYNWFICFQNCHYCPVCLWLLTVYFTVTWVCMSNEVKSKHFKQVLIFNNLLFSPKPWIEQTLYELHLDLFSISIDVYQFCLFLISHQPSINPLSSYFPASISKLLFLPPSIPLSLHPSPFFCSSIIDVSRYVFLQLAGEV